MLQSALWFIALSRHGCSFGFFVPIAHCTLQSLIIPYWEGRLPYAIYVPSEISCENLPFQNRNHVTDYSVGTRDPGTSYIPAAVLFVSGLQHSAVCVVSQMRCMAVHFWDNEARACSVSACSALGGCGHATHWTQAQQPKTGNRGKANNYSIPEAHLGNSQKMQIHAPLGWPN